MPPSSFGRQCQDRERFAETARIDVFYSASPPALVLWLLPYGLSVMRRPIGQPLADDSSHGASGTLHVIYAQANAIAIAEIELGSVAVQMFFAAMLVDAFHAAFENRIVAFDGVGMDFAATVLARIVVDRIVGGDIENATAVVRGTVGHQSRFLRHVRADDAFGGIATSVFDLERACLAIALHKGHDDHLVTVAGFGLASAFLGADESFVSLHDRASAAQRLNADNAHGLTDAVRHEPRGFESDAQGPRELVAADTLLAGAKQVHRLQPDIHRDVAVLENGPDLDGELLPALVALPKPDTGRFAAHLADPLDTSTMGANRAFRPDPLFNPSDCGCFVFQNVGGEERIGHDTYFHYINQRYQGRLGLSTTISPFLDIFSIKATRGRNWNPPPIYFQMTAFCHVLCAFRRSWGSGSRGNDLTGADALPMFRAAGRRRKTPDRREKANKSLG